MPSVNPYALEDAVAALNRVQAYDWAAFFQQRVETVRTSAPLAGLESGGWKLVYDSVRSDYWRTAEEQEKTADLMFSLGVSVKSDGAVTDVVIGGPAQKAGIAPGAMITSVNGRPYSAALLREAMQGDAIELVVKNGAHSSIHAIEYHGGERYSHLERQPGKPDLLTDIVRPRAK